MDIEKKDFETEMAFLAFSDQGLNLLVTAKGDCWYLRKCVLCSARYPLWHSHFCSDRTSRKAAKRLDMQSTTQLLIDIEA